MMRKLLLSAVALAAISAAPMAYAAPDDNNNNQPKRERAANPDRGDKGDGPAMQRDNGPGNGPADRMRDGNGNNNDNDNNRMRDNDRSNDNDRARDNDRNDNDRDGNRDRDTKVRVKVDNGPNKIVVKKTVNRDTVLKFRANIKAPHRFRAPRAYVRPTGWYAHRWVFGERLPRAFFAPDYFILDFAAFGLMTPWGGYEWVRYGDDALLIDLETGEVVRVEYDIFY